MGATRTGTEWLGGGGAWRWLVVAAALCVALAACAGTRDGVAPPMAGPDDALVVASFDFDESRLLAELYAQALSRAGIPVRRELGLGPRELVLPAAQQGLVDLVPEYLGSALSAVAPGTDVARLGASAAFDRLATELDPWGLEPLAPSPGQNQNVVVVAAGLAGARDLRAVSDLSPLAPSLTIGGPPECPQRFQCLIGLEQVYGLRFAEFVAVEGPEQAQRALAEGVAQVVVMFSTDGQLADPALFPLVDDQQLNPPEHVVPVLRSDARDRWGDRVVTTIDEISDRLTSEVLRSLNWRVAVAGGEVAAEARGWLIRQGLVPR
jgi:osmoprotectant transport system substrate-binding protein